MALKKPIAEAPVPLFDIHAFLDSAGVTRRIVRFARGAVVFSQGTPASSVFYIQSGGIKLSVPVFAWQRGHRGHARPR